MTPIYQKLAQLIAAAHRCRESSNPEWFARHVDTAREIVSEHFPSGSGFDSGTELDVSRSTGDKLVFTTAFHHTDEHGSYDGWTNHDVIVRASLQHGFTVRVTGRDRNDIKDYIAEMFAESLDTEIN